MRASQYFQLVHAHVRFALIITLMFSFAALYAQNDKSVTSTEGMAATAHLLATKAAMDMLAKGGNAVDAAVAAAFTLGVVEPDGSGLGGGGGILIFLAREQKSIYINYYQRTSDSVDLVSFDFDKDKRTAKTILVPGTTAGLLAALERFGTLSREQVIAPALHYARDGFPIDGTLAKIILDNSDVLQKYQSTADIFLPEGFPIAEGDTLRQPELAATLEQIILKGRKGFYEGPVAQTLAEQVKANGGELTEEDLRTYEPVVGEPVHGFFRGYEIISSPPPQSGVSVIEALNIVENANLNNWGHFSTSEKSLHFLAETFKRVSADRSFYLGDPKFNEVPLAGLISKQFAHERFADIDLGKVNPPENRSVRAGNPNKFNYQTTTETEIEDPNRNVIDNDQQDDEALSPSKQKKNDLFDNWGKKKKNKIEQKSKNVQQDTSTVIKDEDPFEAYFNTNSAQIAGFIPELEWEGGHTTHLCIADRQGNMVSLTQTLGNFFGSGLTASGVLLNNGLVNFSAVSEKNRIQPGKQPRSSISPTIVLDREKKPYLALGSPGAGRIIPTVVQLLVNILEYKMNIDEANDAPRMYSQKFDEKLYLEGRIPLEVRDALTRRGHQIQVYDDYDLFFGGAQIILFDKNTGLFYGSADKRRGGTAGAARNDE